MLVQINHHATKTYVETQWGIGNTTWGYIVYIKMVVTFGYVVKMIFCWIFDNSVVTLVCVWTILWFVVCVNDVKHKREANHLAAASILLFAEKESNIIMCLKHIYVLVL